MAHFDPVHGGGKGVRKLFSRWEKSHAQSRRRIPPKFDKPNHTNSDPPLPAAARSARGGARTVHHRKRPRTRRTRARQSHKQGAERVKCMAVCMVTVWPRLGSITKRHWPPEEKSAQKTPNTTNAGAEQEQKNAEFPSNRAMEQLRVARQSTESENRRAPRSSLKPPKPQRRETSRGPNPCG